VYRAILLIDRYGKCDKITTNPFETWIEAREHIIMVISTYHLFYHGYIEEKLPMIGWTKTENQL
jgi:hypothetical protein